MAEKLATFLAASNYLLIPLLLLFPVLDLVECRVHKLSDQQKSMRVDLVHRDSLESPLSPGNITSTERIKRAIERSRERLEELQLHAHKLSADVKDLQAPVSAGTGEFLMKLSIGTPALSYSAILDTGSDLTWTQCKPCAKCYKQPTPIFDPSKSSTYSKVPCTSSMCQVLPAHACSSSQCQYQYSYGDNSFTKGILSYEAFTLSSEKLPRVAFGCGVNNQGIGFSEGGLVGFGRGPLSFISQIGPSVGSKFSYCLVSLNDAPSKTSPLIVGSTAGMNGKTFASTPLLQNTPEETYYYLSLQGISVGATLLDIPAGTFDFQSDGSGGFIIDSGTTITYLEKSGYEALRKGLVSAVNLPEAEGSSLGLDLCYSSTASAERFPTVTFHFKGADYVLPLQNYLIRDTSGVICLAMLPTSGLSIFGNIQQQNFHIVYDLGSSTLSFAPTVCDTL